MRHEPPNSTYRNFKVRIGGVSRKDAKEDGMTENEVATGIVDCAFKVH